MKREGETVKREDGLVVVGQLVNVEFRINGAYVLGNIWDRGDRRIVFLAGYDKFHPEKSKNIPIDKEIWLCKVVKEISSYNGDNEVVGVIFVKLLSNITRERGLHVVKEVGRYFPSINCLDIGQIAGSELAEVVQSVSWIFEKIKTFAEEEIAEKQKLVTLKRFLKTDFREIMLYSSEEIDFSEINSVVCQTRADKVHFDTRELLSAAVVWLERPENTTQFKEETKKYFICGNCGSSIRLEKSEFRNFKAKQPTLLCCPDCGASEKKF